MKLENSRVGAGDSPAHLFLLLCFGAEEVSLSPLPAASSERWPDSLHNLRTWHRWVLPDIARSLALESCLRANGREYELYAAVAMPDHVHLICLPLSDSNGSVSIPEITRTIKSESAHRINKALGRTGRVWQDESFDHILRGDESLSKKMEYILQNPVRAGLAARSQDYQWLWWDQSVLGLAMSCAGESPAPTRSDILPFL